MDRAKVCFKCMPAAAIVQFDKRGRDCPSLSETSFTLIMCTLTIIPSQGIRVVCNRDESRLRAAALVPQVRSLGVRMAVMPIDPVGGGTWIGASDAGLVAVLMNVYDENPYTHVSTADASSETRVSRGTIIPRVLRARGLDEAVAIARALDHESFEPFQLIMADHKQHASCIWSRREFRMTPVAPMERPLFFTSSGLGDELVRGPRQRLFDELFADQTKARDWRENQDAFHRHAWPDHRPASVWMTREHAMTVSRTEVELIHDHVTMRYHARVGDTDRLVDAEPISLNTTHQASEPASRE